MINYVIGDATEPISDGPVVIAHIVNDVGVWGKGFVCSLSDKWTEPEEAYRRCTENANYYDHLGEIQTVQVVPEDVKKQYTIVCNMFAQHSIKKYPDTSVRHVHYGALAMCLGRLAEFCVPYGQSVHMPRIGAGLGGGDWKIIEELIEFLLVKRGIEVYVYDLP